MVRLVDYSIVERVLCSSWGYNFSLNRDKSFIALGETILSDMKKLLLAFIYSLTLCDHMGDAADAIELALKKARVDIEWNDLDDLRSKLEGMGFYVDTFFKLPALEEE